MIARYDFEALDWMDVASVGGVWLIGLAFSLLLLAVERLGLLEDGREGVYEVEGGGEGGLVDVAVQCELLK